MTREEALEQLRLGPGINEDVSAEYADAVEMAIEALERENEKTGWHIAHGMYEDRFWCSCGYIKVMDSSMAEWKYCPNCGAKMQEVEHERRSCNNIRTRRD